MVAAGGQKYLQQTDMAKRPMHRVQEQGVRENTKGSRACWDGESRRQGVSSVHSRIRKGVNKCWRGLPCKSSRRPWKAEFLTVI